MAEILMINVPFSGHTNPTLPLATGLVKHGHHVVYVNAPEFREKIERTGAEFIPYVDYPSNISEKEKPARSFRAAYDTALGLRQKFDLLIYEMLFFPANRIAAQLRIPCVRQFSQPAWNQTTLSDASLGFRIACELIQRQVMANGNTHHMEMQGKGVVNAILHDPVDLNIVYVPEAFQSHRETFDERYLFYCPPFQLQPSNDVTFTYAEMKCPLVYVSMGSIMSSSIFCHRIIRAFGGKDLSVILNTGRIDPSSLGVIPQNIYAHSFVPQIEVLQNADLFITHCGMNSLNEAMQIGIPLLAMPVSNDQPNNAKRAVELGIAHRTRAFPTTSGVVYRETIKALADPQLKIRAKALQQEILQNQHWNMDDIVTRIEALIKTKA